MFKKDTKTFPLILLMCCMKITLNILNKLRADDCNRITHNGKKFETYLNEFIVERSQVTFLGIFVFL